MRTFNPRINRIYPLLRVLASGFVISKIKRAVPVRKRRDIKSHANRCTRRPMAVEFKVKGLIANATKGVTSVAEYEA